MSAPIKAVLSDVRPPLQSVLVEVAKVVQCSALNRAKPKNVFLVTGST